MVHRLTLHYEVRGRVGPWWSNGSKRDEAIGETTLFQKMLVALDGSPTSMAALAAAIELANALSATIRVVSVVERLPAVIGLDGALDRASADQEVIRNESASALAHASELLKSSGVKSDTLKIDAAARSVASVLSLAAEEWRADLIVMGTHGRRGARRFVLGSVAESLARQSAVPVLLVPHHTDE